MRVFSVSALAIAGLCVMTARGASVSVVSGTLHADSQARTNSSSAFVLSAPPNVTLGTGTTTTSVSASIHSDPSQGDDMTGTASTSLLVSGTSNNTLNAHFTASGSANSSVGGFGSGTGSVDLIFNLDVPSAVKFVSSIAGSPSNAISQNLKILNSSLSTVYSFPLGDTLTNATLPAGNYELVGSVTGSPVAGSLGSAIADVNVTVVPEPAMIGVLGIGALLGVRRRIL